MICLLLTIGQLSFSGGFLSLCLLFPTLRIYRNSRHALNGLSSFLLSWFAIHPISLISVGAPSIGVKSGMATFSPFILDNNGIAIPNFGNDELALTIVDALVGGGPFFPCFFIDGSCSAHQEMKTSDSDGGVWGKVNVFSLGFGTQSVSLPP